MNKSLRGAEEKQTVLPANWPAPLTHCPWLPSRSPEIGNKLETKIESVGATRGRRERNSGEKICLKVIPRGIFSLIIVKKVPGHYNRSHSAVKAECERQSWLPSRDQVSLKTRGRKEGLFYGRKREKQTHTHCTTSAHFLIHIHEHLQMPGRRDRNMHAFLQPQALLLSDIMFISRLCFYLLSCVHMDVVKLHLFQCAAFLFYTAERKAKTGLTPVHIRVKYYHTRRLSMWRKEKEVKAFWPPGGAFFLLFPHSEVCSLVVNWYNQACMTRAVLFYVFHLLAWDLAQQLQALGLCICVFFVGRCGCGCVHAASIPYQHPTYKHMGGQAVYCVGWQTMLTY